MPTYKRDKRSPIPEKELTSKIMSSIRGWDTKPELALRRALWFAGIRGYRLHWKQTPGRPDICFVSKKVAIFVHGCFWHRCPDCNLHIPKAHSHYWQKKFNNNIQRDKRHVKQLKKDGWKVLVFWECAVKRNVASCVREVGRNVNRRRSLKAAHRIAYG